MNRLEVGNYRKAQVALDVIAQAGNVTVCDLVFVDIDFKPGSDPDSIN